MRSKPGPELWLRLRDKDGRRTTYNGLVGKLSWGSLTSTSFRGGILSTNGHVFTSESSGQRLELSVLSKPCTIYLSTVSLVQPARRISATVLSRILDKELSRKLQLMADLTLALTIQTIRQSEEVAAQVSQVSVHEVQFKQKNTSWKPQQRQQGKSKDSQWGRGG